tara:strand:+ start:386 stop:835 length:450 start_codon:yes stop_codon:yes gene_type:complete
MVRNIISYIFIYILLILSIGCNNNVIGPQECSDCVLELSAELDMDSDGYYNLDFVDGYVQTFARINAYVGHDYENVGWTSNSNFCIEFMGSTECSDVVNNSSYSGMDGIATTILGVHEEHIGETIVIYCGYYDDYGIQHLDSLEVIINE